MKKYVINLLLLCCYTTATTQTILKGAIGGRIVQNTALYIYLLRDIFSNNQPIDSCIISSNGQFEGRIKNIYPSGTLFKAVLVRNGEIINPFNDELLDNAVLFTNEKGIIQIVAKKDTLFYMATITTSLPANKEIVALQKFKQPLYTLVQWHTANKPLQEVEQPAYNERFFKKFLPTIDTYRKQLLGNLQKSKNPGTAIACLYQLMQSSLSSADTMAIYSVIQQKKFPTTDLAAYLLSHYNQYNNNAGNPTSDIVMIDTKGNTKTIGMVAAAVDSLLVINCWASWCSPCREANTAYLPAIADSLQRKNNQLLAVSFDENSDRWRKAVLVDKCNWPQYIDNSNRDLYKRLKIQGLPYYIVVNKKGVIVFETNSVLHLAAYLHK